MALRELVPRSLTQMLRESDDELVRDLLIARPDLAEPRPETFSQVASRATTRESVRRALDSLTSFDLWVAAQAAVRDEAVGPHDIAGADPADAAAALERLRRLGLLWGAPHALRAVRALGTELAALTERPAPAATPPSFPDVVRRDPQHVDVVATGSAFELVRRMDVLLEHIDHAPLRLRQDGGLAQRESRVLGSLLDLPVAAAVVHAEIAQAAGLVGALPGSHAESLLPASASEDWHRLDLAQQWEWLARGWTQSHPGSGPAWFKRLCLSAFGPPAEGRVLGIEELRVWVAWHRPRRGAELGRMAVALLEGAAWLGVTGVGALSSFGAPSGAGVGFDLGVLQRGLPARTEEVLLQNDLTGVAAGPLTPCVAEEMSALADVESRGGATVYRFTVESLRRAYAAGWSTARIKETLGKRSRTPIPQPLDYLISDLDRTRNTGSAKLVSDTGARTVRRRQALRAQRTPLPGASATPALDEATAGSIVSALRRESSGGGAESSSSATGTAPHAKAAEGMADNPLETLREAVETGELVWIGYVDAAGAPTEGLMHATLVEDGLLHARANRSDDSITVPVRRISAAHIIRGSRL